MTISEAVAKRISELCIDKDITVNGLSTLSGITQSTLSSIMNGQSKNPRLETIKKITIGLNISILDFFNSPLFEHYNLDD